MTADVAQYWANVPSVDEDTPVAAGRVLEKAGTKVKKIRPSRRTMFKSAGVLGGALALNVLSSWPARKGNIAAAVPGTEYTHCAGYDGWDGYNNNAAACVGGKFDRSYCGGDGWFNRGSGTCWNSYAVVACGNGFAHRNAWRWSHGGTPYRCADGRIDVCGGSGFFICSWSHP